MSKLKKFGIAIAVLLLIVCLGINVWYLGISFLGNEKIVANTFEVGLQKLEDGDTDYFVEVNYMADMFEVKFNYLLDENKTAFFSQGLQFMADNTGTIQFPFVMDDNRSHWLTTDIRGWAAFTEGTYSIYLDGYLGQNTYNYMSGDNYESVQNSTNPFNQNSRFKITLGEDTYLMAFKGHDIGYGTTINNYAYTTYWKDTSASLMDWKHDFYYSSDVYYFCYLLYNALSTVENGTKSPHIFEFGDLFDYYEYDEGSATYNEKVNLDKAKSISKDIRSYYSIMVNKSANKVQKATDSLFNCVGGNANFNLSGDYASDDYYIGRTVITAGNKAFDLVKVADNNYALKLRDDFVAKYIDIADVIFLRVEIDLDYYKKQNLVFEVDASRSPEEVAELVMRAINEHNYKK